MGPGFDCPSCATPASGPGPQVCGRCGLRFALYPGYAADPSVVPPPPQGNVERIKVKAPGAFMMRFAVLEPFGVADGDLDPLIAQAELSKSGIGFPDVVSITLYRKPDFIDVGVATVLAAPIALGTLWGAIALLSRGASAGGLIVLAIALLFVAGTGFLYFRGLKIQKHLVRVIGRNHKLDLRIDRGPRDRFRLELLRRVGLPPVDMP